MNTNINVGDRVTWKRKQQKPGKPGDIVPVGLSGCRVLRLGKSKDGRDAALLDLGDKQVGSALEDLTLDE